MATPPISVMQIDHVALRVPDYDAAVRWYLEKLGFERDVHWESDNLRFCYLRFGDFRIEIIGDGNPQGSEPVDVPAHLRNRGYIHICLRVENVDETLKHLAKLGVGACGEPFEIAPIRKRLAFVKDPAGNFIELSESL